MNLEALLPLIVLALAALATLLLAAFVRRHALVAGAGVVGMGLFLGSFAWVPGPLPENVEPLLQIDRFTLFYWALIGFATLVTMLFCYSHFRPQDPPRADDAASSATGTAPQAIRAEGSETASIAEDRETPESPEELYGLLMLAALGACVLAASVHFLSLFMGLELMSLSLFVLIAYRCRFARPVEAGIKYLVLSGLATGLLLFGIALVYTYTGTLGFVDLTTLPGSPLGVGYWYAGMALTLSGLAFKLSLAPFHFWTPDVYQGAPAPVTAFLATVSKVAVLAVLLRLSVSMNLNTDSPIWASLAGVAGASILIGNWLALRQSNLKRLLAYSSIAHMGYALAALLAAGPLAVEAVGFYAVFYVITTLGAFGVVTALSHQSRDAETEADDEVAIRGLFWRQPLLAVVMTLMMLSLAGIPLTAGFFGKFYVLVTGAQAGLWSLMLLVVAGSAVGLYYYLRVILAMLDRGDEEPAEVRLPEGRLPEGRLPWGRLNAFCLALLTLALLGIGIYPEPLMALARQVTAI